MFAKTLGLLVAIVIGATVALGAMAVTLVSAVLGSVVALGEWFGEAINSGKEFVNGLIEGIKSGAGALWEAVKGIALGAVDSFKKTLGIASPSKVMMAMGGHMASGVAEGVEGGEGEVKGATSGLATASVQGFSQGASAPSTGGGGGKGNVFNVSVQIDGAGKSGQEITQEMVARVFELFALQAGV